MYTLCDTSSILMLIRIAPEMFLDARFQCVTLPAVKNEIFRTTRFKTKFQWRDNFKNKIKCVSMLELEEEDYKENYELVNNMINSVIHNENTGRLIDLSRVDKIFAVYAITNGHKVTTGDKNLAAFLEQQFDIENIYPLEILNYWITEKLVNVDESLLLILADWAINEEPPQPQKAIEEFEKITGIKYPGPLFQ
jgi:hypothetical protein